MQCCCLHWQEVLILVYLVRYEWCFMLHKIRSYYVFLIDELSVKGVILKRLVLNKRLYFFWIINNIINIKYEQNWPANYKRLQRLLKTNLNSNNLAINSYSCTARSYSLGNWSKTDIVSLHRKIRELMTKNHKNHPKVPWK